MNTTSRQPATKRANAKSAKSASALPISRKAYLRFTDRINRVYGSGSANATRMLTVLDRYLAGDYLAGETLPVSERTAFAFLRHEIDMAISRSCKARERARLRRAGAETATPTEPALSEETQPEPATSTTEPDTPTLGAPANDNPAPGTPRVELFYETVPTYEILNLMPRQKPLSLSRKDRRALQRQSSKKRNKPLGSKPSR